MCFHISRKVMSVEVANAGEVYVAQVSDNHIWSKTHLIKGAVNILRSQFANVLIVDFVPSMQI